MQFALCSVEAQCCTLYIKKSIIFYTDYKAAVSIASLGDVEQTDRRYLLREMTKAVNMGLNPYQLIKRLYANTFCRVAEILEDNKQHLKSMVRAAQTAIKLELTEGDANALTSALTVDDLLKELCISEKWYDIDLLDSFVCCLPEDAKALAISLLQRYELHLKVHNDAVMEKDSLKEHVAAPEWTGAHCLVEVTVAKDLSEFSCKDCNEMLDLLLRKAWKIPLRKGMVTETRPGFSTTVVFIIDKAFTLSIIRCSTEESVLWSFQELQVTRIRIPGLFEVNVSQLLAQHLKEALRRGLTGSMDFVGATKVCGSVKSSFSCLLYCGSTPQHTNMLTYVFVPLLILFLINPNMFDALCYSL